MVKEKREISKKYFIKRQIVTVFILVICLLFMRNHYEKRNYEDCIRQFQLNLKFFDNYYYRNIDNLDLKEIRQLIFQMESSINYLSYYDPLIESNEYLLVEEIKNSLGIIGFNIQAKGMNEEKLEQVVHIFEDIEDTLKELLAENKKYNISDENLKKLTNRMKEVEEITFNK